MKLLSIALISFISYQSQAQNKEEVLACGYINPESSSRSASDLNGYAFAVDCNLDCKLDYTKPSGGSLLHTSFIPSTAVNSNQKGWITRWKAGAVDAAVKAKKKRASLAVPYLCVHAEANKNPCAAKSALEPAAELSKIKEFNGSSAEVLAFAKKIKAPSSFKGCSALIP